MFPLSLQCCFIFSIFNSYNLGHNILRLYQNFLTPQVKRNVFISNKHDIYELTHELSDNLRLWILGNKEIRKDQENFKTS